MVTAPKNSISGEAMACWRTYRRLLRRSRCARSRKRFDFDFFRAERFHHLVAAERFLQHLIELGGVVLRAPRGSADALAQPDGRDQHERQTRVRLDQRQPPIRLQAPRRASASAVKLCRSQSARMCDSATWIFSRSFMIDDMTRAVELDSKNCAS